MESYPAVIHTATLLEKNDLTWNDTGYISGGAIWEAVDEVLEDWQCR
jgi:uncharacterized protein YfiM (DUF2279 family)